MLLLLNLVCMYLHNTFSVKSIMCGCMGVHSFFSDSKQWAFIIPWLLCQESGRSLVWLFWLWVSLEAAVKVLARFAVTWKFHWDGKICSQSSLLTWLLAGGLSSSPCGHLHTSLNILMIWHLASPRVGGPRERGRSHTIFYSLVSAHSHFHSSLPLYSLEASL